MPGARGGRPSPGRRSSRGPRSPSCSCSKWCSRTSPRRRSPTRRPQALSLRLAESTNALDAALLPSVARGQAQRVARVVLIATSVVASSPEGGVVASCPWGSGENPASSPAVGVRPGLAESGDSGWVGAVEGAAGPQPASADPRSHAPLSAGAIEAQVQPRSETSCRDAILWNNRMDRESGLAFAGPLHSLPVMVGPDTMQTGHASPRPVPRPSPFVVKKGSKILASTALVIPAPVSVTASMTYDPGRETSAHCLTVEVRPP
jgi:hypothetical protein